MPDVTLRAFILVLVIAAAAACSDWRSQPVPMDVATLASEETLKKVPAADVAAFHEFVMHVLRRPLRRQALGKLSNEQAVVIGTRYLKVKGEAMAAVREALDEPAAQFMELEVGANGSVCGFLDDAPRSRIDKPRAFVAVPGGELYVTDRRPDEGTADFARYRENSGVVDYHRRRNCYEDSTPAPIDAFAPFARTRAAWPGELSVEEARGLGETQGVDVYRKVLEKSDDAGWAAYLEGCEIFLRSRRDSPSVSLPMNGSLTVAMTRDYDYPPLRPRIHEIFNRLNFHFSYPTLFEQVFAEVRNPQARDPAGALDMALRSRDAATAVNLRHFADGLPAGDSRAQAIARVIDKPAAVAR